MPGFIVNTYLICLFETALLGLGIDLNHKQSTSLLRERSKDVYLYSAETMELLISYSIALKHSSSNSDYSLIAHRFERYESLNKIILIAMFMICHLFRIILTSIWLAL